MTNMLIRNGCTPEVEWGRLIQFLSIMEKHTPSWSNMFRSTMNSIDLMMHELYPDEKFYEVPKEEKND